MTLSKNKKADTVSQRFRWVLTAVFGNSQSKMAEALGCSQSILSRIVRGKQKPGARLLMALADQPSLSRHWVLTGEGPPLASQIVEYEGEAALPIAARLFDGLPYDHPDCLETELFPVERRLHRRSRYWVRAATTPYFLSVETAIRKNDWILFDAAPENWPGDLRERLCIVGIDVEGTRKLAYAQCTSTLSRAKSTNSFKFFDASLDLPPAKDSSGRFYRHVEIDQARQAYSPQTHYPAQIVAIAIYRCGEPWPPISSNRFLFTAQSKNELTNFATKRDKN